MGKSHQTVQFIKDRRPDSVLALIPEDDIPEGRIPVPRLGVHVQSQSARVEDERLAEIYETASPPNAQFVLDTCFLTGPEISPRLWAVLRDRTVVIPPLVWTELESWLRSPVRNQAVRDDILHAKDAGAPWIRFLPPLDLGTERGAGVNYYIRLLSFRKRMFEFASENLKQRLARTPLEEELQKEVRRVVQDRGWQLAAKGREDRAKATFMADEETVVRAFAEALESGRETNIVTRDTDLPEQFYKMLYLLDTHYRSMLLGDAYHDQPLNFREQDISEWEAFHGYEAREATLIHLPAMSEERVLPFPSPRVILYCTCLGDFQPPWKVEVLTFNADQQMLSVFDVKGKTKGKNTDKYGDRNFHRCINPHATELFGSYAILAHDVNVFEDESMRWAAVDVEMSLRRFERGRRVQYVMSANTASDKI